MDEEKLLLVNIQKSLAFLIHTPRIAWALFSMYQNEICENVPEDVTGLGYVIIYGLTLKVLNLETESTAFWRPERKRKAVDLDLEKNCLKV